MEPIIMEVENTSVANNESTTPQSWGTLVPLNSQSPTENLTKYEVVIGRGKEADIKLPNDIRTLSNKHCVISLGPDPSSELSLCCYILDTSANGTFIDGKQISKGQRVLLVDGAVLTLVHSNPTTQTGAAFKFHSNLRSLSAEYTAHIHKELHHLGFVNVVQRAQTIDTAHVSSKNIKKPEQFIHILKVEPTVSNLAALNEALRWCFTHNDKWVETFISLGGISGVLGVVAANNKMSRTFEADVHVDFECLKILEALIGCPGGMDFLVSRSGSLDEVVLTLLNPNHPPKVKSFVLNLFCTVCEYSELGYKLVVSALERLKVVKREKVRFQFLAQSLITELDVDYKIKCMTLVNSIASAAGDETQSAKHKQEFVSLGFLRILEVLYQEHNPSLDEQLDAFSQQIDPAGMWYRTVNLDDPVSMCKAVHEQLKRDKKAIAKFNSCLRRMISICTASESKNSFSIGISKSLDIIEKTTSLFASLSTDAFHGKREEYGQLIDAIVKEYTTLRNNILPPPPPQPILPPELVQPIANTPAIQASGPPPPPPPPPGSSASPPPPPPPPPGGSGPPPPPPPPGGGPPPPPPPPGGGPPPPPPPPGGSGPPPPPPPGGPRGPPPLPGKKAPAKIPEDVPKVAMKQFYWTKLPATKVKNTVWDADVDAVFGSDGKPEPIKPFNKEEMERLFCAKKTARAGSVSGADEQPEKKEVSLLDMRRSNNIGISISRFKMTPEGVGEELMTLPEATLTKEKVGIMLKCVPTPDEVSMLVSYKGDVPLAPVEQFLLALTKIPRITERLECLQFKLSFEGITNEIRNNMDSVFSACDELMNDDSVKRLLLIVLKMGNFMNGGSARGSAVGFKLNNLLTVSEVKSADNKSSLLHFIVNYIQQYYPEVLAKCAEKFKLAEAVSRIVWKDVLAQFELVKVGMKKLHNELEQIKDQQTEGDCFYSVLSQFEEQKVPVVETMGDTLKNIDAKFISTASYFGEEGVSPEDFFSMLHEFNGSLTKVQKDIEKEKIAAVLAEKRKEGLFQSPFRPPGRRGSGASSPVDFSVALGDNAGTNEGSEGTPVVQLRRKRHGHSASVDNTELGTPPFASIAKEAMELRPILSERLEARSKRHTTEFSPTIMRTIFENNINNTTNNNNTSAANSDNSGERSPRNLRAFFENNTTNGSERGSPRLFGVKPQHSEAKNEGEGNGVKPLFSPQRRSLNLNKVLP